jgi:hypothetical protein
MEMLVDTLITNMGSLLLLMCVPLYPPVIGWVFGSIHDRFRRTRPETGAALVSVRLQTMRLASDDQEQSADAARG